MSYSRTTRRTTVAAAVAALLAPGLALSQAAGDAIADAEASTAPDAGMAEVVVLGNNIPDPMVRTAEIVSLVTPEDLQRQGDDTAASALRRVTGLSLVQGKFVYVRGLGERYSAALLNGSPLPSPEPLQRVVPLDLFPSNVLAGVVVQKTYSAKYPGEFGGGLIDLTTVGVPDAPFLSFSAGTGWNSESNFRWGLTHYGSDTDILGFDDGARDIPRPLLDAMATGRRVDSANFSAAELQQIGRSFVNAPLNLLQATDSVQPNFAVEVSGGRNWMLDSGSLGVVAVVGLDNGWTSRRGIQQEGLVENGVISPRTDYDFVSTQNDAVVNGLLSLGADFDDHQFKWTNFYVHTTTKETRTRAGNDESAGAFVRDDFTEWLERGLIDSQLAGTHSFGPLGIDWRAAWARTTREAPYEKGIRYRLVNGEYLHNASQEQNYTRFSEVTDEVRSAGLDFTWKFAGTDGRQDTVVSAGGAWLDNEREAWTREFRFLALDGSLPLNVQRERVDFLLSNYNIAPGFLTLRETTGADGAAAYDGTLEVRAGYLQVDAEPLPLLRTSVGVRYEDGDQRVVPRNLFIGPAPAAAAPLQNDYVLPTATLTWNFAEDMQIRIGASKTIGRPQFRELAPQQYVDSDSDRVFVGNPFLVDTEMLNIDTRFEWYFDDGEFLTAGLFYKDLDKPIESIVNEAGSTVQQTYINAPAATVYGAEVEARKYFGLPFEAEWWQNKRLLVGANYTWSDSEVEAKAGDVVYPLSGNGQPRPAMDLVRDGSRLQGQSQHLANFQLGIEDMAQQFQVTLLATYVGERISARGRPGQPDLIQDPGVQLDLVYRQGFGAFGQDLSFALEARNLTDEDYEEFQELGGGRVDLNRYDLGRSISLSLTARF